MPNPSGIDQVIIDAQEVHVTQAYDLMDRLIDAIDPVTGLLPLHVHTKGERLMVLDHSASGLDMGRSIAGLVMLSRLAGNSGDPGRADRYLGVARDNYSRGKDLLAQGDFFVHQRLFDDDKRTSTTQIGEHGNSSRVNARAYAFRAAAELHRLTGESAYLVDFLRYFHAWLRDFHDANSGGFFIHGNVDDASDHSEPGPFRVPGGLLSEYDGNDGVKGNDGTIYALSSVLLEANDLVGSPETQDLVKEELDIILRRLHREQGSGMLWENYTHDWKPISVGWQSQPMDAPLGPRTSHVAIGGHTAMAPQLVFEGARQLRKQARISAAEYSSYIEGAMGLFQDFSNLSGAVDWETGALRNGMRVEDPRPDHRQLWPDAGWQQAELIQTLLRFREEELLQDIEGPDGTNGDQLLRLAEQHYIAAYALPTDYRFDGFGNPDTYHRPQLALYHHEVVSQL